MFQVLGSCNKTAVLRQACPQLALACLTACVRQLDSLTADQLAQAAFISTQTHLRLNIRGADQMRTLVRAGVARAPAMSALSLTQFMYGAAALGNLKPAHLQVCLSHMSGSAQAIAAVCASHAIFGSIYTHGSACMLSYHRQQAYNNDGNWSKWPLSWAVLSFVAQNRYSHSLQSCTATQACM